MTLKYLWRSFQPTLSFPRPFHQSLPCFRVARSPSNSWASCLRFFFVCFIRFLKQWSEHAKSPLIIIQLAKRWKWRKQSPSNFYPARHGMPVCYLRWGIEWSRDRWRHVTRCRRGPLRALGGCSLCLSSFCLCVIQFKSVNLLCWHILSCISTGNMSCIMKNS